MRKNTDMSGYDDNDDEVEFIGLAKILGLAFFVAVVVVIAALFIFG